MVRIDIAPPNLVVEVQGADKFFALKSRLVIPLAHVVRADTDPAAARKGWKGLRLPGTSIPGVLTAGSFYWRGVWTFWDVRRADRTIVIDLRNERYSRLVVEVADPEAAVRMISAALPPA